MATSPADRQYAVADRAVAPGAVAAPPGHHAERQRREEVGVAVENPKAATFVFGADRGDVALVDDDGSRGGDQEPHYGFTSSCAARSRSCAWSSVPVMYRELSAQ